MSEYFITLIMMNDYFVVTTTRSGLPKVYKSIKGLIVELQTASSKCKAETSCDIKMICTNVPSEVLQIILKEIK